MLGKARTRIFFTEMCFHLIYLQKTINKMTVQKNSLYFDEYSIYFLVLLEEGNQSALEVVQ